MTKIKEIWKSIVGYEGIYQVSNLGNIKRVQPARGSSVGYIFTPSEDTKGYLRTRLTDCNGKARTVKVHRIVCAAFHKNAKNLPQVNHKDTIKTNNKANNLEWCTGKQNQQHAIDNGIIPKTWLGKTGAAHNKSIPIRCVNIDTGEEKIIIGINEAARQLKTTSPAIWRVLTGEYTNTKRWIFSRI